MNKRQQKKIAKQQILSNLQQSQGLTKRQAREQYAQSYSNEKTPSLRDIEKGLTKVQNFIDKYNAIINHHLNSIIPQLDKLVNTLEYWRQYYIDKYDIDVKELGIPQWLDANHLKELDNGIDNLKEYLTGNRYIDNLQTAINNVGDTHNVYELIHKYMREEMETTIKSSAVVLHVRNRFELMAEEYFFDSDQVRQQQAIQATGAKTFTDNPIDPSLYNK